MKLDLNKILEPKANGPEIAILLVELLNVRITKSTLTREIEQHPDNPSLLSISDVLNAYGIENIGIKFNTERFTEIPAPFVTQFKGLKREINFFTIVKEINEGIVHFFEPEKRRWDTLPTDDFVKRGSEIALLIEVGENAGEKDYIINRRNEKRKNTQNYLIAFGIPIISIIAGVISLVQHGTAALLPFVFTMLTLVGAFTTTLLLWYELDQHNPLLQQICSAGNKINCGAVLHSKASKIGGISWSAIGFSYFMGILLFLLTSGITSRTGLFITSWISFVATPYVLFSVYYQWRIVTQWCVMCLSVGALLLLQLTTAVLGSWHTLLSLSDIGPVQIISAITIFSIPLITTILLMPALQKAKDGRRVNIDLQKLKHNKQVFEALLQKQKQVNSSPKGLGIFVGNPNAPFKLIKVCNPYCNPCSKAHIPMEELLHNNPEVQIQLIFTASNKEWDIGAPPVKHLLAIADKGDETILKQALDDWYLPENKNYQAFAAKYPMNGELKRQDAKINAMKEWCIKMEIEYTPTFFVSMPNDSELQRYHQLPKFYTVADLKYFFAV